MVYTAMLVLIQISSQYATNLMDPKDYAKVLADPKQVADRIYGSKIVIGLEQCMLFSTWGVKVCMLALFMRLTKNLARLHLYVKGIAVYVAVGFAVIMITYYAVYCRPFQQYWAMPVKNMQCATYQHYSITQAVFNISSDAAMLVVPVPLLMKTQMRLMRKLILLCVMSLGTFTIIAAILNKYFNFASPYTTTYQIWYIREASTAIYVANLMCWWPLLRKLFGLKAFQHNSRRDARADGEQKDSNGSRTGASGSQSRRSISLHRALHSHRDYQKSFRVFRRYRKADLRLSEEAINQTSVDAGVPLEERVAMQRTDESLEDGLKECDYYAHGAYNDHDSQGSSSAPSRALVKDSLDK